MDNEKGNFEFVKEPEETKRNYIFQKDKITKNTALFVIVVLILLIIAVVITAMFLDSK